MKPISILLLILGLSIFSAPVLRAQTLPPPEINSVYVSGEVKNPGLYDWNEGDDFSTLLTKAGGATPEAALSKVMILTPGGARRTLDLRPSQQREHKTALMLETSDFVVVPRNENRVLLMEAVPKPGFYTIPEDGPLTLWGALALAGGFGKNCKEILILRSDKVGKVTIHDRFTPADLQFHGQNLQNGDLVYVGATLKNPRILLYNPGICWGILPW